MIDISLNGSFWTTKDLAVMGNMSINDVYRWSRTIDIAPTKIGGARVYSQEAKDKILARAAVASAADGELQISSAATMLGTTPKVIQQAVDDGYLPTHIGARGVPVIERALILDIKRLGPLQGKNTDWPDVMERLRQGAL